MISDKRVVVVLTGRDDTGLIRYADAVSALHRAAAGVAKDDSDAVAIRGGLQRPSTPGAQATGPAIAEAPSQLVLDAPQVVEYVQVSCYRPVERILTLAAQDGTAAVLVGESLGRRHIRTLVRRSPCSVWFVPAAARPAIQRILTPVDFSVRSADSLRVAAVLGRLSAGAHCLALHVYFHESSLAGPAEHEALRARVARAYADFVAPIDTLNVPVTPLFEEGACAARTIKRIAVERQADLLVLGTRGRSWIGSLLHKSLAEETLPDCPVPLLVLKHFGARLGLLRLLREPAFRRRGELRFG
jgi:nucleotide-binding universal stress UspA family protein